MSQFITVRSPLKLLSFTGKWRSAAFADAYGATQHRLVFEFVQQDDRLLGTVTDSRFDAYVSNHSSTAAIADGRVVDKVISFYTTGQVSAARGEIQSYKESYFGTARADGSLEFRRFDDLPTGGSPEKFIAKRIP